MFMVGYLIAAIVAIIILIVTIKPFPDGPFPQAGIIPFVAVTIVIALMFYVPFTIQKYRFRHTCEKRNKPVCF